MSVSPDVERVPLSMGPLATAVVAGALPGAIPGERPHTTMEWRQRMLAVREPMMGVRWADTLREAMRPTGAAAARLARVSDGQGVVVTTGQQPGLFGGPMYTLTKALSALALADRLEAETGVPTAPVFWAATDDADFAEGAVTWLPTDGSLTDARLLEAPPEGTMMSHAFLGDISAARSLLRKATAGAAWTDMARSAMSAYRDGATVGNAYVEFLRDLLSPLGITVLNAAHPSVRHHAAPILRRALVEAQAIDEALIAHAQQLRGAGFSPQVELAADKSLVFVVRNGVKERARISTAASVIPKLSDDLLSANVLLRPVIERALLPTVAYVAGPGELAYFAQVAAVATALSAPQPLAVGRASVRVVPPAVRRTLSHYGESVAGLLDTRVLVRRLATDATAAPALDALTTLRAQIRSTGDAIAAQETGLSADALRGSIAQFTLRADRLERRMLAASKGRLTTQLARISQSQELLWPHGAAQERVVNPLPWLARYGTPLLEAMQQSCAEAMSDLVHADA
jgi:bacillithiol synthase